MKKLFQFLTIMLLAFPAISYGQCLEGECSDGFGIYVFPEGGQYSGQFAGGEFTGKGNQAYAQYACCTGKTNKNRIISDFSTSISIALFHCKIEHKIVTIYLNIKAILSS
jgi:hypothetical protein